MKIRVATSDQAQALSRSLPGSTGAPRKDGGDASFDGVMSHVADDHASGAADKDAASPNASPNSTPPQTSGAAAMASASDPLTSGLLQIVGLTGDTIASWKSPKLKTTDDDKTKASSTEGFASAPQTDLGVATLAAAVPQSSLLALVQSAAAVPPSTPSADAAGASASSQAAAPAGPIPLDTTLPTSSDLTSAVMAPLISNVSFQTYLAPATTGADYQKALVTDQPTESPSAQPAVGLDTPSPAGAQPTASASTVLATLVAPLAQAVAVAASAVSVAPAAASSKDGLRFVGVAVDRAAAAPVLDRSLENAPARGDAATPDEDNADRPPADDKSAGNALPGVGTTDTAAPVASFVPASASVPQVNSVAPVIAAAPAPGSLITPAPAALPAAPEPENLSAPASPITPAITAPVPAGASASGKPASVPVATAASPQAASPAIDTPIASFAALPVPLQSVADAVTGLAAQVAAEVAGPAPTDTRLSPARTLLLQLNPGDLGTVNVRLHLTGRTLDVSLTASKDQTADLLDRGRDTLTRVIGDQDYQINSLVVQRGDPQRGDAPSLLGSSNATTDLPRDQGASQGGGEASGGGGRQGADGSPARQDRSDRQPQVRPVPPARGSGLFL